MSRADDLLKRFEERNAESLVDEGEERLRARVICFTRVELLRSFLQLALARAVVFLKIPPNDRTAMEATFTQAEGKIVPAIQFTRDVKLPVDVDVIAGVMGRFFKAIYGEWGSELKQGDADEAGFQEIAGWLDKHPETPEHFAKRLKRWCA